MKKLAACALTLMASLALMTSVAFAAPVINYSTGAGTTSIPGLTGFMTTGAMMDNLAVTASFSNGLTETVLWADTGAVSGGVTGTGWGLALSGDTFTADWDFTIDQNANLGQLTQLTLDGRNTFTIFDRTDPSPGTAGSAQGADFVFTNSTCDSCVVDVLYDFQTSIGAALPVGDLWQFVQVTWTGGTGPRVDFLFRQDTDNDSRITQVPAPGTGVLVALGLAALCAAARRCPKRS